MKKLKVGIVGLGGIATRVHIPVLLARDDVELIAAAEVNDTQRMRSQQRFDIKKVFSSYKEMLENCALDAVYICLPNQLHLAAVAAALTKGLHVYCEKPVGLSSNQLPALVELAESKRLVFMPGYNRRFRTNYMKAREIIRSRLIGKMIQIQAASFIPGPYAAWDPKSEWYYNKENYGVLYDQGSHVIDLINFLTGVEWETIFASYDSSLEGLDIPDNIVVTAKNMKTLSSINIGWNSGRYFDVVIIYGTAGILVASSDSLEHIPPSYGGIDKITYSLRNIAAILTNKIKRLRNTSSLSDPEYMAISDHFIKSVLGLEKPKLSGEDALKVHQVLDAVKESLKTQRISTLSRLTI